LRLDIIEYSQITNAQLPRCERVWAAGRSITAHGAAGLLAWTKATFHVPIRPPGESKVVPFPVAGIVSGPFGIFRGVTKGPDCG
jgi:hypothetical protein